LNLETCQAIPAKTTLVLAAQMATPVCFELDFFAPTTQERGAAHKRPPASLAVDRPAIRWKNQREKLGNAHPEPLRYFPGANALRQRPIRAATAVVRGPAMRAPALRDNARPIGTVVPSGTFRASQWMK
jgi:hypothetical protein